ATPLTVFYPLSLHDALPIFAQFVKWPPGALGGANNAVTIGVLGNDPFGGALDNAISGQAVSGHPLTVRRSRNLDALKNCQIIFRSEEHTSELQSRENLVCRL